MGAVRVATTPLLSLLEFIGECTLLVWDAIVRFWRRPFELGEVFSQMSQIGVSSIPIVVLTTFFSGSVLALYTTDILVRYSAVSLAGGTIGLAVTREVAPVLAGIMVAARSGSAMAAQIGTMNVTEQVDALRALSVNPTNYLVIPRIVASVTMLPMLALLGMYAGIVGGYVVSVAGGVPAGSFLQSLQRFLEPRDFWGGELKTVVFGLIVSVVACQQGLRTKGGAVGVGRATTSSVVISMVLIYVANFFLADALY